ncbi:MAG TPA: hypothetical protein VE981_05090 [Planctomycetota bacterium]|nr:hypothetical protein [Planctomycetota bacterium]
MRNLLALGILVAAGTLASADEETIKDAAAGTPEATVAAALKAALAGDFEAYVQLLPAEKRTDEQRASVERYEWARFKRQAAGYVKSKDPLTFVIVRREPKGEDAVKLFIKDHKVEGRMPVPVQLKKDGNTWLIVANAL